MEKFLNQENLMGKEWSQCGRSSRRCHWRGSYTQPVLLFDLKVHFEKQTLDLYFLHTLNKYLN